MPEPRREISAERQLAYYGGMVLTILGLLLFCSNFFHPDISGGTALGGMALMAIGQVIRAVGAKGLAGAGVILDPQQTREDLEPWNRAQGGMIDDTLSEIKVVNKIAEHLEHKEEPAESREVVKVRCRACQSLNDEHARFCSQCGSQL